MNKKILWLVIVAFGLLGGIFFFPLPVGGSFTCLFHRWLMPWNSLPGAHPGEHMVHYYVRHFSFFWWGRLLMVTAGIYVLIKKTNSNKQKGLK